MAKVLTSAVLLLAAVAYLVAGLEYDVLTSNGRLGAGFFPRVIGVGLVLVTAVNLVKDVRGRREGEAGYGRDAAGVAVALIAFVVLLNVVGGVVAMVVFLFATLALLNRGRWLTNGLVSVALPIALFLLFSVWLNAPFPQGAVQLFGVF